MKHVLRVAGGTFFLLGLSYAIAAQPLKEPLFNELNAALKEAQLAQANIYAPRAYERAMKYYQSAQERFERGRSLESIRAQVDEANIHLRQATEASHRARLVLGALIKTRGDAEKVDAARHAAELWKRAEDDFGKAIADLERGASEPAKERAQQAERQYRDAELIAIKATYLTAAGALIAKAEKEKIHKLAPKTLERAKTLLAQAEKALTDNRYDTDLPRSLAQQARYEARHAVYLAALIERAREQRLTMEDIILDWETPVREIAAAADVSSELDKGYREPTNRIIAFIDDQQLRGQKLDQETTQLQAELGQLQKMVGGISEQRAALSQRLRAQAQARQQLEQVEKIFSPEEARVLREASDLIIRLVGLSFESGQATIDPKNFRLLTKLQGAIRAFPESKLIIEGHTDSWGSDAANYGLSQRRAEAVKEYLLANTPIDPAKIEAIGYGETRPIANNETGLGRAKNRRIDIVIRTNPAAPH